MKLARRPVAAVLVMLMCVGVFTAAVHAAPRPEWAEDFFAVPERKEQFASNSATSDRIDRTGAYNLPAAEPSGFRWLPEMLAENTISKREEGLTMRGVTPELTEAYGTAHAELNARIAGITDAKIAAAKESKARSIQFDYTVYNTKSLISIVLLSTVTTSSARTEVETVNFIPGSGELVELSGLIAENIVPLAEKLLTEEIRRYPEKYNAVIDALPASQAYYLTETSIVLLFNEFYLVPQAEGVTKLEIELNRLTSVSIEKDDYFPKPGYELKMIPLRMVCGGLGYELLWEQEEFTAGIYKGGELVMELTPGVNSYLVRDKFAKQRTLEAAPELIGEHIFVPISFFDQVLSLITYIVDENEGITFLSYMDSE